MIHFYDIEDIEDELDEIGQKVTINGKNYKELINVSYDIDFKYHKPSTSVIQAPSESDKGERNYLLQRIDDCIKILNESLESRQAVFSNVYPNNMCKCICLVHLFIRNGFLHINEYYRSQDFLNNFQYDCETASILMSKALDSLPKHIKPGRILVSCVNLHKQV